MSNLDITDTRAKLQVYSNAGLLELGKGSRGTLAEIATKLVAAYAYSTGTAG